MRFYVSKVRCAALHEIVLPRHMRMRAPKTVVSCLEPRCEPCALRPSQALRKVQYVVGNR